MLTFIAFIAVFVFACVTAGVSGGFWMGAVPGALGIISGLAAVFWMVTLDLWQVAAAKM